MSHKSAELIAEFIFKAGLKKYLFAESIGVSRSTIHKYLTGHRIKEKIAHRIERFTNKKIKAEDLIE